MPQHRPPIPNRRTTAVFFLLLPTLVAAEGATRFITVANECTYTVWPAMYTQTEDFVPTQPGGWEAASGTSVTFEVSEGWAGRIWGRNNCDFTTSEPDYDQCATGGCIGGLVCNGTGTPPANLAEFNLQEGQDNYDSSNVDGFNIPMAVTNTGDCPLSNCPYDLLLTCPEDLKVTTDAGDLVGCFTDCGATNNPEYCCAGDHATPDTCPSSAIPNYSWWKASCPVSYAYAYDESSGTALFTCESRPDWIITFCPDSSLYDTDVTLPNGSTTTQGGDSVSTADSVSITDTNGGSGGAATTTAAGETSSAGGDTTASATAPVTGTTAAAGTTTAAAASGTTTAAATSSKTSSGSTTKATTTKASTTSASSSSDDDDDESSSSSSNTSSSSSSSEDDSTILGISPTFFYSLCGVAAVLVLGAIAFFVYSKGKKKDDGGGGGRRRRRDDDDSASSSDSEEDRSLAKGGYAATAGGQRVNKAQAALYAAAAKDPGGLAGVLGAARERERGREGTMRSSERLSDVQSGSEEDEDEERKGLRSRRSSVDDWV